MKLTERCEKLYTLFTYLEETTSMLAKNHLISLLPDELKDDFNCCIEVLNKRIVFGFTWPEACTGNSDSDVEHLSVRDAVNLLSYRKTLRTVDIWNVCEPFAYLDWFFEPLVNRAWRLGIGNSLLGKTSTTPMLAKKYEGEFKTSFAKDGLYITEKLDGNRCIAYYNGEKWCFKSRNGKEMFVQFDMTGLPTEYIYDGEVISPEQVKLSEAIYAGVDTKFTNSFNSTSGLINTHTTSKQLVYTIFDIIDEQSPYKARRAVLEELKVVKLGDNVRILPVLAFFTGECRDELDELLERVVNTGGEGLMMNYGNGKYMHSRTASLLKYKQVQTIDMRVRSIQPGEGKYVGMVGALHCATVTAAGKFITCDVGSGLSDAQRRQWALRPTDIVGKIVEVAYFSLSQSEHSSANCYSLRFPRLKTVRQDKFDTSEY